MSKIKIFIFHGGRYCPKWELMFGNIYNLEVCVQMNKGSDLGCRETWYEGLRPCDVASSKLPFCCVLSMPCSVLHLGQHVTLLYLLTGQLYPFSLLFNLQIFLIVHKNSDLCLDLYLFCIFGIWWGEGVVNV